MQGLAENPSSAFVPLQAVVKFEDDTWLEGFFKDGILHGFCRYFDSKGRLTFVGMHRNGKPFGTCWKVSPRLKKQPIRLKRQIWADSRLWLQHGILTESDNCIDDENVGKGEDFLQVIYCGVQKGMIDNSRLCNKGLTNRETVVTIWAGLVFRFDLPSDTDL